MAKKKININPLGGRVLVKPLDKEETTIALGTGKVADDGNKIDFNVKVGDRIMFKQYAPDELELDDETYLVLEESDILAVIK